MVEVRIVYERVTNEVGVAWSHTLAVSLASHTLECGSIKEAKQALTDMCHLNGGFYIGDVFIPWHQVKSVEIVLVAE